MIAPEQSLKPALRLKKQSSEIEYLAEHLPFIHYLPSSRIGAQTDLVARRMGVSLNTQFELDSTQTLLRFVRANMGWAIISALCLVRYPELISDIKVINLDNGSNARFISQVTRKNELGDMPDRFAAITRKLFTEDISPKLRKIAPWLADQSYAIDELPSI